MSAAATVVAILVSLGFRAPTAAAPSGGASRVCDFQPLPLPDATQDIESLTTARDGMLFVASQRTVWVRGPWGWESVWTPGSAGGTTAAAEKILGVTTVAGASGDVLIIATAGGLWEVSWAPAHDRANPWARLQQIFTARRIAATSPRNLSRGGDTGPLRGYASTQSGDLHALLMKSRLELGPRIVLAGDSQDVLFARLTGGWTAAWKYRASMLYLLGPDGEASSRIDIAKAISSLTPAVVETVWHDARNQRLFIGTDYGLVVAATDTDTPRLASAPAHVDSLGLIDIGLVTRIAGRVVVAFSKGARRIGRVDQVDASSPETVMTIERDPLVGRPIAEYVRDVRFTPVESPPQASPSYVTSVAQVAGDVIWASSPEGVWEWAPDSWQLLDKADEVEPQGLHTLPDGALVGVDLIGRRLSLCVPPADLLSTHAIREGFGIANLIPDPDGDGFWGLEPGGSVNGADVGGRGYLRYLTQHGEMPTTEGTRGGHRPFDVARLSWQHPNGRTDWPESEHGGLLLPSGNRWLHVRDGAWRAYDWPSSAPLSPVRDLVPGGESSTTAWVGVAGKSGSPGPVVRVDVSEDRQSLAVTSTGVKCESGEGAAEGIAADETGHRWLVCAASAWTLRRIHPIDNDAADRRRTIVSLPEPPRYLFTQPLREYVLTDHGVAEIARDGTASFTRLLKDDDDRGRLDVLAPSLPRLTASIPSEWTVFARHASPPSGTGRAFVMSILANGASLNPLSAPSGALDVAGWMAADPGDAPGAVVWTTPDGAPSVEWYDVRSGVPENRVEPLRLDDARDAVRFRRADFKSSVAAEGTGVLAISSARRVGMLDVPRRRAAPLAVVTSITIERRDGSREVYDLRHAALPEVAPHDAVRVVMAFAQDYDNWWRPPSAQVRGSADAPWTNLDANGRGAIGLTAGSSYALQYRVSDRHRLGATPVAPLTIRTERAPQYVPYWAFALAGLSAVLLVVTVSGRLQRHLLVQFGRRWSLSTADTPNAVYVVKIADLIRVSLRLPGAPNEAPVNLTEDPGQIAHIRARLRPGDNVRVIVDDELFAEPWSAQLGTPWSKGADAVVAGQVGSRAEMRIAPQPTREVAFTSLVCARPPARREPLERAAAESEAILEQVKKWGASVRPVEDAACDDLLRALRESDVVHVAAHASLGAIELADRDFTMADLTDEVVASMRTRLLILSACQASENVAPETMLVIRLVRAGVNVIAASNRVDDGVCRRFFVELFRAFLPGRAAAGIAIASAIRSAATACKIQFARYPDDTWKPTVDGFQLYGDPSLHFVLKSPTRSDAPPPPGAERFRR